MNYLGIDWGMKKIGLALAGGEMKMASPLLVLDHKNIDETLAKIKSIINKEDIGFIVLGKPVSLSGSENYSGEFNRFAEGLKSLNVQTDLQDERLSTKYAARLKRQFKGHKKIKDDDIAAAAILQSYLDREFANSKSEAQSPK
ncbi:MAG: Holliday junction resolvase RuvX [Parcubacteria group bacterium]